MEIGFIRGIINLIEVLMKVCKALECNIGGIMVLIPKEGDVNGELKEKRCN